MRAEQNLLMPQNPSEKSIDISINDDNLLVAPSVDGHDALS